MPLLFALLSSFLFFLQNAVIAFGYIQSGNLFPEPLSSEEEKKYIEDMNNGNDEAKNILIERNLRLVAHISKKYNTTNCKNIM